MILDAITSSPLNVFLTIFLGIGLAYLYCRKQTSSSSSASSSTSGNHSSRTGLNNRFRGRLTPEDEELQRAIAQIERQERDMIRQEQDEAYRQSLQADREKRQKREEELRDKEAQEKAERDRVQRQEELHSKLTELKSTIGNRLPNEPASNSEGIIKLVFKLPDGTRCTRYFRKNDKVKLLYWYVFSLENAPLQFRMTTNFPKRELPGRPPMPEDFETDPIHNVQNREPNCEQTLEDADITETQIIFVYDLEA